MPATQLLVTGAPAAPFLGHTCGHGMSSAWGSSFTHKRGFLSPVCIHCPAASASHSRWPAPLLMELPSSVDSRRGGHPAGARGLQPHVTELCGGCTARRGGGQSRARAPRPHRGPTPSTLPGHPAQARPGPGQHLPPSGHPESSRHPQACLSTEAPPLNPGVLAGSPHPQASSGRAARPPEMPPASLHLHASAPSFSGVLWVLQTAGVTGQR